MVISVSDFVCLTIAWNKSMRLMIKNRVSSGQWGIKQAKCLTKL